ncbi:MAG TPA: hypothetical protein VFS00_19005 [Polyangiaceae bacterium]|nr:hypothetical protein [Polyangiaceae bacterium]
MVFWRERARAVGLLFAAGLAGPAGCGQAEAVKVDEGVPARAPAATTAAGASRKGVEAAGGAAKAGGEAAGGAAKAGGEAAGAARAGVEIVAAPVGDEPAEATVRREAERARAAGRTLLVYLGAPWCEPCVRFHDAAKAGALDAELPGLTVLEFDHDRDSDRLRAAGYAWRYVPLFARPGADGRASGRSIEGSIKGEGAVAQIVPRLRGLLAP